MGGAITRDRYDYSNSMDDTNNSVEFEESNQGIRNIINKHFIFLN